MTEKELLTVNEVSEKLRISRNTVNRWIHAKKIPAIRYGKQWRIKKADIAEWLERGDQERSEPEKYIFEVIIEPDEGRYHAYVFGLRGCRSWGHTEEEAEKNIQEALELYLEALIEDGDPIPGVGLIKSINDIEPIIKIKKEAVA
jgi:excisionase family DNA binding protein